jgi:hypothetical protein
VEFPPNSFDFISVSAKSFVKQLLQVQDDKRLTAKQVIDDD